MMTLLVLLLSAASTEAWRAVTRRSLIGLAAAACSPPFAAHGEGQSGDDYVFKENKLGFDLAQDGKFVRMDTVKPNSPALAQGVPPLSVIVQVNGESTAGLDVGAVTNMIRSAARPVTIRFDSSAFRALPAVEQTQLAAASLGMETDRINIELLTGPQDST